MTRSISLASSESATTPPIALVVVGARGGEILAGLVSEGFAAASVPSAAEAVGMLSSVPFDIVVVDESLGGAPGLLDAVRDEHPDVVVFVLSSLRDDEPITVGAGRGAEVHVRHDISVQVLVEQARSGLRPKPPKQVLVDRSGRIVMDVAARQVQVDGELVYLRPREFDLLRYFVENPGVVHTRQDLLTRVWGSSSEWQSAETVTEHIRRIRRKVDVDPSVPPLIETVRGIGYRYTSRPADSRSWVPSPAETHPAAS